MRALIVEDSKRLAESIRTGLCRLGHAVDVVHDGSAGLSYARSNPYDAVILDLMLPGLDGLSLLRALRAGGHDTRVLVLSARDTVDDRVNGMRQGADDYLVKPFAFEELVARLEALARRPPAALRPVLRAGALEIDTAGRRVTLAGQEVALTRREFAVLQMLAERRGKVVTRIELEDRLYDERTFPVSNAVESAISRLRAHLARPGQAPLIRTRRGQGYVLDAGAE